MGPLKQSINLLLAKKYVHFFNNNEGHSSQGKPHHFL